MRIWILGSAAVMSLGLAFAAGHDIRAQLLGQTSDQAGVAPTATLPPGYRDWPLISVAAVGPPMNDIRAKLGNDITMSDLRQGMIPHRDGAIIARLAWKQTPDERTNNALGLQARQAGLTADAIGKLLSQSFVAGPATNVQFMVKNSKNYASTGGWAFEQFTSGKPDAISPQKCFACHEPAKATDFVFTRYAP